MILTVELVAETDLITALGDTAALQLEALLDPAQALTVTLGVPSITVTLGPYIEVVASAGDAGTAGATINGHRVVAWAADGTLVHADPTARPFSIAGLTESSAVSGAPVAWTAQGQVTFSGWSWVGGPVFLGADGTLTQSLPSTGYVVVIGRGDGTHLFVNIQPPVAVQ